MAARMKINDRKWREVLGRVKRLDGAHVKVGVLSSKGGDADHGEGITMVELAAIHEFGSPAAGIPQRSFIRRTLVDAPWLPQFTAKLARGVVELKVTETQALGILGEKAVLEIKRTITDGAGVPPPLAEATIAAKGSTRPLVDHGRLLGAISYSVVDGKPPKEGM